MANLVLLVPLVSPDPVETVELLVKWEFKERLEDLAGMEPLDFRDLLDLLVLVVKGEIPVFQDTWD